MAKHDVVCLKNQCQTLVLRLHHAIYCYKRTYACAAELATWGIDPDVNAVNLNTVHPRLSRSSIIWIIKSRLKFYLRGFAVMWYENCWQCGYFGWRGRSSLASGRYMVVASADNRTKWQCCKLTTSDQLLAAKQWHCYGIQAYINSRCYIDTPSLRLYQLEQCQSKVHSSLGAQPGVGRGTRRGWKQQKWNLFFM